MDYRIEKRDAFQIVCKKKQVTKPQGDTATADIAAFWNECGASGLLQTLCRYGRFDRFHGVLGVCFQGDMAEAGFPYGIGAEYNGAALNGEALDIVDIPAYTYAVFQCRGKMPDAFKETYQKIGTEFFPQSNYAYGSGVELEVYPSERVQDPDYACEIWIAVNEKK